MLHENQVNEIMYKRLYCKGIYSFFLFFFQNEEIFIQIGQNHPYMNGSQLQPHRRTENILVQWLEWQTAKQVI